MPTLVKMPKWGLTMTAGTVTDWLCEEGARVSTGDPLLTVETEKAVNDVEAPVDGVLRKIVAAAGVEAPVGGAVAILVEENEELTDAEIEAMLATLAVATKSGATASGGAPGRGDRAARTAARDAEGRINASPAARKRAAELNLDLASIEATGPGGRITSDDVERVFNAKRDDPSPVLTLVESAGGPRLLSLRAGPAGGTPLVFIHGLSGSLGTWQVVLGELAERHRVIAVDLPGHGGSDKPSAEEFDYSLESLAAAVIGVISSLGVERAMLVGHSLGGSVALQIALARPELTSGVVLVNSAGLGSEISGDLMRLMTGEPGADTARGLLQLFYENQRLVLDRGVEEMAAGQRADGAWAAQQATAAALFGSEGRQTPLTDRLAEVTAPTLIVWGMKDRVLPVAHAFDAAATLSDATLRLLPTIGHVPQVEDAPGLTRTIERFARSLAS